jgi:hypothetical protein
LRLLRDALAAGRVASTATEAFQDGELLGRLPQGECGFHGLVDGGSGCRVEAAIGWEGLAHSCRQFPRLLLADAQGWHQSLSVWCGTAAALVVNDDRPLPNFLSFDHILTDPRVHVEGLDARAAWPPLLRPGVLAGLDGYDAWERAVLTQYLARVGQGVSLSSALLAIVDFTEAVRAWSAPDEALPALILARSQPSGAMAWAPEGPFDDDASFISFDLIERIPTAWRPAHWPDGLTDPTHDDRPLTRARAEFALCRYLGTRLVASWVAYQGGGLRSVAASVMACYALAVEALASRAEHAPTIGHMTDSIRATDWLVLHLLDRQDWASWCSQVEDHGNATRLRSWVAAADRRLNDLPWPSPTASSPAS